MQRTAIFLLLIFPALAAADTVGERMERYGVSASALFHEPRTPLERQFFEAGLYHFWQRYGGSPRPGAGEFKGYILFADPYHRGLGRISFLLGSDCSHLVQRVYQMLGAPFPYAKTRHWIRLAAVKRRGLDPTRAYDAPKGYPIDLPRCRWLELARRFERVEEPRRGDVFVYENGRGARGLRGHMGLISAVEPLRVLHARNHREGIVESAFAPGERRYHFFRWSGSARLLELDSDSFVELAARRYPETPVRCSE